MFKVEVHQLQLLPLPLRAPQPHAGAIDIISPAASSARRHLCNVESLGSLPFRSRIADLGSDIRAVVAEIRAQDALVQQLEGPTKFICQKRLAAAFARLEDLQARLPNAARTFADLVLLAELAYWWARKAPDGTLLALAHDANPNEHYAARLIDAVLTMAGPRALTELTNQAATIETESQPASPDRR